MPDVSFLAVTGSLLGAMVEEENSVRLQIVGTAILFGDREPSTSF